MLTIRRLLPPLVALLTLALMLAPTPPPALAYVEAPYPLGYIIAQSTNIMVLKVEAVDKQKNLIVYSKVRDLKGTWNEKTVKHNIGTAGFHPREWQNVMQWADIGKTVVFFHNNQASETCIGTYWYQAYPGGEWWNHSHGEPFLLRSYAGNVDKLITAIVDILAGKEVVVSCMVDGNKDDLHMRRARIQRCKASLKLQDYNPKRDFVGWGGDVFRRVNGMPGFTEMCPLGRVDADAQSVTSLDMDGDGKPDLCLAGAGKVMLLQNGGESLTEFTLPPGSGGRAAVWADYNGDGKPDLLLATASGPRLYTNIGSGKFRDDTYLLPPEAGYNCTSAAWIDYDGDGKPDILLGNGYHGLRLYRNVGAVEKKAFLTPTWYFKDVSDKVGLGAHGIGSTVKGDTLTICDVDGDGRPDFLYGAGTGLLVKNTPQGFVEVKDSGIVYKTGKVGPVFADYDNTGFPSLLVPQSDGLKLFKNDGKGRFTDVTAAAGLGAFKGYAICAAWGDVDNDGHVDFVVGCLRGHNRYFHSKGDGTFEDKSEAIGLDQRIFNTQALCLVDLNGDGVLDMVFNNEGQDSVALLGNPEAMAKRTPVIFQVAGKTGVTGSKVRITDNTGKLQGSWSVSGGDGRGGQASPTARFALTPGDYRIEVRYSDGSRRARQVTVAANPVRGVLDEKVPIVNEE